MIEVRNLMFQPLTFHLSGDMGGIHLNSRERKLISSDQVSDEMRAAASRGFISLAETRISTQPSSRVATSEPEHNSDSTGDEQAALKRRKRRQA